MSNFLTTPGLQDILVFTIVFIAGVVVKAKFQWGRTNTDAIETLTKDYEAMKVLYDAKCDELKRKDELLNTQHEDLLQAKARITSYENFLQSRSLQTDNVLKQVPHMLEAIAAHLNIPLTDSGIDAHESAHSQIK